MIGHEGGALMNEFSILRKETPETSYHFCHVRLQGEDAPACEPGGRSQQTLNLRCLDLGIPILQNYEKYMCVI